VTDAAVRGDIPLGYGANISGVLAENDNLLPLKASLNRLRLWAGMDRVVFSPDWADLEFTCL
jgi:hypothetical protein